MDNETNPYAASDNQLWAEGKYEEWEEWNRQKWKRDLADLTPEEREQRINSRLRFQHRCQSQATDTPDFKTWSKQVIEENPWILG